MEVVVAAVVAKVSVPFHLVFANYPLGPPGKMLCERLQVNLWPSEYLRISVCAWAVALVHPVVRLIWAAVAAGFQQSLTAAKYPKIP